MDALRTLLKGTKIYKDKNRLATSVLAKQGSSRQTEDPKNSIASIFAKPDTKNQLDSDHEDEVEPQSSTLINKKDLKSVKSLSSSHMSEEEVNAFRNRLQIKVKSDDNKRTIPSPEATFHAMKIDKSIKNALLRNIELSEWKEPTPIQMQAIPILLAGRDLLASAPTGSGKTAAFVIPILSKLASLRNGNSNSLAGVKSLILAPTLELTEQIYREVNRLTEGVDKSIKAIHVTKHTLNQVGSVGKQFMSKYDIVVSTPLRLLSLLRGGGVDLNTVQMIVLDEADKLLELESNHILGDEEGSGEGGEGKGGKGKGKKRKHDDEDGDKDEENQSMENTKRPRSSFLNQVDEILAAIPIPHLQRALFSATLPPFVLSLGEAFLSLPVHLSIGSPHAGNTHITQELLFVGREDGKLLALRQYFAKGVLPPILIFVQSVQRAKELHRELLYDGLAVEAMHAQRSPAQRMAIMKKFRLGEIWVLITSDLLARGVDFPSISLVINYDLPLSPISYIHRIGRTGRGGREGKAVTFFTEGDIVRMRGIANVVKLSGGEVPPWMLNIKQMSTKKKRKLRQHAPPRRKISTSPSSARKERSDE